MRSIDFIRSVQYTKSPVFSTTYTAKIISKNVKYASLFLSRLVKSNEIKAIEKNKYYVNGTNIYAVASNITYPSYVSMFSAFRYHSITTQNISMIDIISAKGHTTIKNLDGYSINFIKFAPYHIFGFYRDFENNAFIAHIEKAIVDSLHRKSVPFTYVIEAAESAIRDDKLDINKLNTYAYMMKSKILISRLKKLYKNMNIDENKNVIYNESFRI